MFTFQQALAFENELLREEDWRKPKKVEVRYNVNLREKPRATVRVAVVMQDLCSGGPEEGGWWYNAGRRYSRIYRVRCCRARKFAVRLAETVRPENTFRDYRSVLGGWKLVVCVGGPFNYPERRPRYE